MKSVAGGSALSTRIGFSRSVDDRLLTPGVLGSEWQGYTRSISSRLPEEAERSVEVDLAAFGDTDARKADLIDGAIGKASMFHETFGYYAEGVTDMTATLPAGWRDRLARYESPATNGVVAWCLELHDLWQARPACVRSEFRRAP